MRHAEGLRIDGKRLVDRLEQLGQIGRRDDGSRCRLALTDEDRMGRDLVVSWMQAVGLAIHIDRVGNILGIRPGQADLPPVMTGSHLDTVATGGMLDGSLGVLAGLEVVQALNEARVPTRRSIRRLF